jgi:hypothetical protein
MERMSEQDRTRRLGRMLAVGQQRARTSERNFAIAVQRSADAAAQLSHIEGLILTAAPEPNGQGVPQLAAAAQLRALLMPAAAAASARLEQERAARIRAEAEMETARARARRLADIDTAARQALATAAHDREAEARPAPARRKI